MYSNQCFNTRTKNVFEKLMWFITKWSFLSHVYLEKKFTKWFYGDEKFWGKSSGIDSCLIFSLLGQVGHKLHKMNPLLLCYQRTAVVVTSEVD